MNGNVSQRIGVALMTAALDHLRGLSGVRVVALAVTVGSAPTRTLYRTMGVDRMRDTYWDTEWMVLELKE